MGLEVLCKSGQIEASSSAIKVDCDGDVVSDSGSCKNDASEETPKLFILQAKFLAVVTKIQNEMIRENIFTLSVFRMSFYFTLNTFPIYLNYHQLTVSEVCKHSDEVGN